MSQNPEVLSQSSTKKESDYPTLEIKAPDPLARLIDLLALQTSITERLYLENQELRMKLHLRGPLAPEENPGTASPKKSVVGISTWADDRAEMEAAFRIPRPASPEAAKEAQSGQTSSTADPSR